MKGRMNRRVFAGSLIGAGAALATGSKLITPVRAQSESEMGLIIEQTAQRMNDYVNNIQQLGQNPLDVDMYDVASAASAMVGIARQYGLDNYLNDLYGTDGDITQAGDWAYQEGGWNQYWALGLLGTTAMAAEYMRTHPPQGDFNGLRTGFGTGVYINGTGPFSSQIPGMAGYAEGPLWPATIRVGPGKCLPEDDGLCQTGGFKDYPYYNVYNSWIPTTIFTPGGIYVILLPENKAERCTTLGWSTVVLGVLLGVMSKTPLGKAFKVFDVAVFGVTAVLALIRQGYCG